MLWGFEYKRSSVPLIELMQGYLLQINYEQLYRHSCTAWCLAQLFSSIMGSTGKVAIRNFVLEMYIQSKIHNDNDFDVSANPSKLLSFIKQTIGHDCYKLVKICPEAFEIVTQEIKQEIGKILAEEKITKYDQSSSLAQVFLRFSVEKLSLMHTYLGVVNIHGGILLINPSGPEKKTYQSMKELEKDETKRSWISIFIDPNMIDSKKLFSLETEAKEWGLNPQNLSFLTLDAFKKISQVSLDYAEELITLVLSSDSIFQMVIKNGIILQQLARAFPNHKEKLEAKYESVLLCNTTPHIP